MQAPFNSILSFFSPAIPFFTTATVHTNCVKWKKKTATAEDNADVFIALWGFQRMPCDPERKEIKDVFLRQIAQDLGADSPLF